MLGVAPPHRSGCASTFLPQTGQALGGDGPGVRHQQPRGGGIWAAEEGEEGGEPRRMPSAAPFLVVPPEGEGASRQGRRAGPLFC